LATHDPEPTLPSCRFCGAPLDHTFVDLGLSPLCESYVAAADLNAGETFYPLHAYVCGQCFLVQLEQYVSAEEIFRDYAYFSSYSDSWLAHSRAYVEMITRRLRLHQQSLVVELASNDGYLLQYFAEYGVPVLGIEPAENVAKVATEQGIDTLAEFFTLELANQLVRDGVRADLVIGNNVLAQVPDLNDFVAGVKQLLKPDGVVTMEFPHLARLVEENQFDTIYHEHFSYFSFSTACRIFAAHGLSVFDVDEVPTHGGSLRIYAGHDEAAPVVSDAAQALLESERRDGLDDLGYYRSFAERVEQIRYALLEFLIAQKRAGKRVVGYGAPGKGNTLLNYCGVRSDLLEFTVDRSPHKQGMFLPGTRIPIYAPETINEARPDFILILPWNIKDEIVAQLDGVAEWGAKFVTAIPEVRVLD
jgi:SAM-dependent methyltransferase